MSAHRLTTNRNPKRLDGAPMYWPIVWGQGLDNEIETEAGALAVAAGGICFALATFALIALGLCC